MKTLVQITGKLTGVYSEKIPLAEPFEKLAARFADEPGTVLLMSGGDLDCARYHVLGLWPWLTLKGKDRTLRISVGDQQIQADQDPLDALREILNTFQIRPVDQTLPLTAGLMG